VTFDRSKSESRRAKLQTGLLTPFDHTLYIDADSVVQHPGVEVFSDCLENHDMEFNWPITFKPGEKIWNIYARCMKKFGVMKPISIYNGGIIAFKKNPKVRGFFETWLRYWEVFGCGREMPPLNCAIKSTGINHSYFPLLFFADNSRNDACVIQHNYNGDFNKRFGIAPWKEFKPFDGNKDDFRFERIPA